MKNLFYAICSVFIIAFMTTSCSEQPLEDASIALEQSKKSKNKKDKDMDKDKVAICHYSKGSDSWKTITVSSKALKSHLKHGDFLGECDEAPEPSCTDIYVDGFETNASGWITAFGGTVTRVASGANSIASSAGGFHGVLGGDGYTAPRSVFEGIGTLWQGDWTAEIDVYLDPNWATSTGFEYTVGANGPNSGQILDFVFHINNNGSTGNLFVGASTDPTLLFIGESPREDLENGNNYEVTVAGWYKLQHVFYDNGGVLFVDLNLLDSGGNIVFSETINSGNNVGGQTGSNNYGWFNYITVQGGIAVDEHKRLSCPE